MLTSELESGFNYRPHRIRRGIRLHARNFSICLIPPWNLLGYASNWRVSNIRLNPNADSANPESRLPVAARLSEIVGEFLWEVDPLGFYTYVGCGVREVTGYEPDELIGQHWSDLIVEASRPGLRAAADACFAAKAPIRSLLNELITKDGRHVTVLTNGRPVLAADGSLASYCGSDRDVTELFRTQHELQRFRNVMDQANFGIAIADEHQNLSYVNTAFAQDHGYTPSDLLGQPIALLHLPSQIERVQMLIDVIHREGKFAGEEVWHRRADGTEFPMLMTGIRLTAPDGTQSIAATALDITDRKRVEQELEEAKAEAEESANIKSAFLAMISHEFRTPLNHIIGFSSLIAESSADAEILDYAQEIQRSGDEFLEMIVGLLDLATLDAVDIRPRNAPFSLAELIGRAEVTLQTYLDESGNAASVQVNRFHSGESPADQRVGDAPKLYLILVQLIKNAVKFTASGSIGISYDEPIPGVIRFAVQDSGVGLSPEKFQEVSAPFVQGDSGLTRRVGGLGIGLAVSRKIAKVLDGEVRLGTSSPGRTVIEVLVPLPVAPPKTSSASANKDRQ